MMVSSFGTRKLAAPAVSSVAASSVCDVEECYYCGLKDPKVEAGGMWHCPNTFCQGPGAFYGRTQAGYHGEDGILYQMQEEKMFRDCIARLDVEPEGPMREALFAALGQMVQRRKIDKMYNAADRGNE